MTPWQRYGADFVAIAGGAAAVPAAARIFLLEMDGALAQGPSQGIHGIFFAARAGATVGVAIWLGAVLGACHLRVWSRRPLAALPELASLRSYAGLLAQSARRTRAQDVALGRAKAVLDDAEGLVASFRAQRDLAACAAMVSLGYYLLVAVAHLDDANA